MPILPDPKITAWLERVNDSFSARDAEAVAALLEQGRAKGWLGSIRWSEAVRLACNARSPQLVGLFMKEWPHPALHGPDGRSLAMWAALNADEKIGAWGGANRLALRELIRWIPLDAVLARPDAMEFADGSAEERADTWLAAQGRLRLMHFAARENNASLIRHLIERGADPDGGLRSRWPAKSKIGALGTQRRDFEAVPASTPLALACKHEALEAAKALARAGASIEFKSVGGELPPERFAGAEVRKQALSKKLSKTRAMQWAQFGLELLADQRESLPAPPAKRDDEGPRVVLAVAQLAREALRLAAQASGLPGPSFERAGERPRAQGGGAGFGGGGMAAGAAQGLRRSPLATALRWLSPGARSEDLFFRALGFQDRELMGHWAREAAKRAGAAGAAPLRVRGAPPAAWIAAIACAREAREKGFREEEAAAAREAGDEAGSGQGSAAGAETGVFGANWGSQSPSAGAAALFAPLAQELGPSALDAPIGAWGGVSALGAAALCDCPGAVSAMLSAGASASPVEEGGPSALLCAALGRSRASSLLAAQKSTASQGMNAALEWAMAREPEAARECFRTAADAQEKAEKIAGAPIDPESEEKRNSVFSMDSRAESLSRQASSFAQSDAGQAEKWRALSAEYERWRLRQASRGFFQPRGECGSGAGVDAGAGRGAAAAANTAPASAPAEAEAKRQPRRI